MSKDPQWILSDHVCGSCLGRVLVSGGDVKEVICADCGQKAQGGIKSLCVCGIKLQDGRSAGLKCIRNPTPTVDAPQQFVAVYVGVPKRNKKDRDFMDDGMPVLDGVVDGS